MWKNYSWTYIKNNRASSISVIVAAFISALFLSFLSSVFYNFWNYEIERLTLKEGAWQGRLSGELAWEDIKLIQNYANVKNAVVNEELSNEQIVVVDIYLDNMRSILTDMPRIAEAAGLPIEAVAYHHTLLSMYLIRDPQDAASRLVYPFVLGITAMACASLVMIIHNSFAVSMRARVHQFGIFSSIGATPRQIKVCLLQEAAALCFIPIIAGNFIGIISSRWMINQTNVLVDKMPGRHEAVWKYHPFVFLFTFVITILTIWISAWLPAKKMSRMTPLEAIKNTGELGIKKKKEFRILFLLFGVEGLLAGSALKAQKQVLRTAAISLFLSFLAFTLIQCFLTLMSISQRMTYFEKYKDAWDIMVTVPDTEIQSFDKTEEIQALSEVESGVVYQKAYAKTIITENAISKEVAAWGGFEDAPKTYVKKMGEGWLVNVPIIILDDASFLEYCQQLGVSPRLDGTIIRNQIKDVMDPDFRNRDSYDYVKGNQKTSVLRQAGKEEIAVEVPVLAYTREVPVLKEEYGTLDLYELVHFVPVSLWKEIKEEIGDAKGELYIRILTDDNVTLEGLTLLQEKVQRLIMPEYEVLSENRLQEEIHNKKMIRGMMMVGTGFCILLALIGIGNVFSNTMGFARQRKREFARYMSIGLTSEGIRKMFCIEAALLVARPIMIALPLTIILTGGMIKLSYLKPMIFMREAPVIQILVFIVAVFGFVALAYYISWKQVRRVSLTDALRDDTMM